MPFIGSYNGAMKILSEIGTEKLKSVSGRNAVNQHSKTLKKYKNIKI